MVSLNERFSHQSLKFNELVDCTSLLMKGTLIVIRTKKSDYWKKRGKKTNKDSADWKKRTKDCKKGTLFEELF